MRHVADLRQMSWKLSSPRIGTSPLEGWLRPGEGAEQRGFAGAVVAEDGVEFAAGKFGGDAAQGGEASELLDQVRDGDDGVGVGQVD